MYVAVLCISNVPCVSDVVLCVFDIVLCVCVADVANSLDSVALSKRSRTQVYSGRKSDTGPKSESVSAVLLWSSTPT